MTKERKTVRNLIRKALSLATKVEAGTHVVVPVEPTQPMIMAGLCAGLENIAIEQTRTVLTEGEEEVRVYKAMIQAVKDTQ